MPLVTENDQKILDRLKLLTQEAMAALFGGMAPAEQLAAYRAVMLKINPFKHPEGAKLADVASFEPRRELRAGLTASIAIPHGTGPFPILVHVHGHGLVAGKSPEYEPWIRELASHGFVVVFPDYSWQPEVSLQHQVDEMLFAANWAKQNAQALNIDPDRMALGGDSMGAALAFETLMQSIEKPAGVRFGAFACVDGSLNLPPGNMFGMNNPPRDRLAEMTAEMPIPPFYFMVGSDDGLLMGATAGMTRLQAIKKNFAAEVVYGMPHDFAKFPNMDAGKEANARMMRFLHEAL